MSHMGWTCTVADAKPAAMILSDNMRAAILMMMSMSAFTINDAFMKLTSEQVPFFQGIFLRGVMITIGLLVFLSIKRQLRFRPDRRDWGLIGLRTFAEATGTVLFLTALYKMPIANLTAILQALPLTVTLAAALIFKEPVGWRRLTAIVIGFAGVLLIVQPGADGFTLYSVYGLLAVLCVTLRDLSARRLSPGIPSGVVALGAAVGVSAMAGVGSTTETWIQPSVSDFWRLAGAAGCLMVGYISAVSAMRLGDIGFVAPFRYTSLLVALIIGLVLFGEWPDPLTLTGAAIVVATGLFTLYRERHSARSTPLGLRVR